MIECLTDNKNRTGSDIRGVFTKNGGSMAQPGSVAWQFERKGVVLVAGKKEDGTAISEDDVMLAALDAGAEDVKGSGSGWEITSPPSEVTDVRDALVEAGIPVDSADSPMMPSATVELDNESDARKVFKVIDLLEDLDDVQGVYSNFDVSDEIIELVQS